MGTCAPHLPTCPLASFGVGSRGCRLGGAMAPLPGAADPLSHGEHNPLSSFPPALPTYSGMKR
jgi:hypothetical protein